jgi:hypothetical protein
VLKPTVAAVTALVASSFASGTATPAAPTFAGRAGLATTPAVSSNWSGYVATAPDGGTTEFTDVTATWAQPQVTCTIGRSDSVAFWVGLGGNDPASTALEQLGTEADCNGSSTTPVYSTWWEIVPAAAVKIPIKIRAGDRINAAVLVKGQTVTMSLKNLTRKTRFSKTQTVTQSLDLSSAEWIVEAPSLCTSNGRCRTVPLTQFLPVTFTGAAAIGNGHPGVISDPAWTAAPVELITGGGGDRGFFFGNDALGPGVGATPGDLSSDGRSFSVTWQQNLTPPPTP